MMYWCIIDVYLDLMYRPRFDVWLDGSESGPRRRTCVTDWLAARLCACVMVPGCRPIRAASGVDIAYAATLKSRSLRAAHASTAAGAAGDAVAWGVGASGSTATATTEARACGKWYEHRRRPGRGLGRGLWGVARLAKQIVVVLGCFGHARCRRTTATGGGGGGAL